MIKINNKELNNYTITVLIDPLSGIINGKKIKTETPYIRIKTNKNFEFDEIINI